ELAIEVRAAAFLDGPSDALHLLGALGSGQDLPAEIRGEGQRDQRDDQDHPERGVGEVVEVDTSPEPTLLRKEEHDRDPPGSVGLRSRGVVWAQTPGRGRDYSRATKGSAAP